MSITDELREYVIRVHRNGWLDKRVCDDLLEIADRIGAAHRSALEKVAAMIDEPDTWERIIEDAIDAAFEGVDDESEFDLKKMELVDRCRRLAGEDA